MKKIWRQTLATLAFAAFGALGVSSDVFAQDESRLAPIPCIGFEYAGDAAPRTDVKETIRENNVATYRYLTDGKLETLVRVKSFEGYPVREISVRLTNLSETEETGVVKDFRSFKQTYPLAGADSEITINWLAGSNNGPADFSPHSATLKANESKTLSTPSGRSSNEWTPFLEANFDERNGLLFGIGWTGDWLARFSNDGGAATFEIGMEKCAFKLRPGESVLQPSVLVFERKDQTRREFKTTVHRFMREKMSPRDVDGKIVPPILAITAGGGNKTPQMMRDVLKYNLDNNLGCDTYWVDAGWYGEPHEVEPYTNCGPVWWKHVGDWRVNTTTHPTGDLLPIADAVHAAGMRFLLWFEPERVFEEVPLMKEHPEYVRGGLFYYGNPEALAYMQKTVYGIIEKHKIDIYRQDFNMDPSGAWATFDAEDGPDRVGIAEAKHVEGLYKFLDDMRAKFPNILQENCASGGRRIDFEMIKRAHSYCRSDYFIGPKEGDTEINLGQNMTLNTLPYLPFQGGETNCATIFDDYAFMSVASSGTVFTPTDFDGAIVKRDFAAEETEWFKKMFGWCNRLKPYYMGDFYQLTDETGPVDDVWCGWSCHRGDLNEGFALVFRRGQAPDASQTFELPAVDPNAQYEVEYFDGTKKTVSGKELATLTVELEPRSFSLIVYKKI